VLVYLVASAVPMDLLPVLSFRTNLRIDFLSPLRISHNALTCVTGSACAVAVDVTRFTAPYISPVKSFQCLPNRPARVSKSLCGPHPRAGAVMTVDG
jgi:hypothetical protein